MKKTNLIILTLLILIIAAGTAIYLQNRSVLEEVTNHSPAPPTQPIKKPIIHYPVPEVPTQREQLEATKAEVSPTPPPQLLPESLPEVEESDQSIQQSVEKLINSQALYKLLFMDNFIQRFVATIDNLPEKQLPRAHLPIKPPGGSFVVSGTNEAPQTSSRNHKRYTPYVTLLETLAPELVIKIYIHFYPLFQSAYEQLGYKNAYFNDRMVFVVNHLLETPNRPDPILLAQPAVLYTYADPLLENRSSGQKTLLRLGQEQRSKVLEILEMYRQELTNLKI